MNLHDAVDDGPGLLRGVSRLLPAVGTDDGVPPHVRGRLAPRGLERAHQRGRHVGNAVHGVEIEGKGVRILGVPENVVVLGGPALSGARPVIVRPDDFIDEGRTAENAVQHDLAVMDFPVVEMKEQRSFGRKNAERLLHARPEKARKVVEPVVVSAGFAPYGAIDLPLEAHPVAVIVAHGGKARAPLHPARVEGRVDIDEVHAGVRQGAQHVEIVGMKNGQSGHEAPLPAHGRGMQRH